MIDLNDVPFAVRGMVAKSRKFNLQHWKQLTPQWDLAFKILAVMLRRQGEAAREKSIKENLQGLQEFCVQVRSEGDSSGMITALACLSDQQLDDIISTFEPGILRSADQLWTKFVEPYK